MIDSPLLPIRYDCSCSYDARYGTYIPCPEPVTRAAGFGVILAPRWQSSPLQRANDVWTKVHTARTNVRRHVDEALVRPTP